MKAVILAGGLGSRLSEETTTKPKPMVEIGGRPILWHIMKTYSIYGVNEFIVACGYKGEQIKEYFLNYSMQSSDVSVNLENGQIEVLSKYSEPWKVTLVDTGENTATGGRIKRVADLLKDEDSFCLTYGDGLSDIDIGKTIEFHNSHGKTATITAVRQPSRFGAIELSGDSVIKFTEKPPEDGVRINGGYFVLNYRALEYINDDYTVWEQEPLMRMADEGELKAYEHNGFWQPMDTLREKRQLEELWSNGRAPWKKW
jgi:glucose-1-phosphate cytidylyltransferase